MKLSVPMLIAPKLEVIEPASRAPTVVTFESVSSAASILDSVFASMVRPPMVAIVPVTERSGRIKAEV